MFGPAAKARSASCVRSPNSARNVVVKESRITVLAGIDNFAVCNVLVWFSASEAMWGLESILLASASALTPNSKNATPEMILMVSMDTIDFIHTPAVIQSPAPIVRAITLPVNTQRALCLAARTSVVKNDLSPMPATATVANAVVKPATYLEILQSQNIVFGPFLLLASAHLDMASVIRGFLDKPCCALPCSIDPFKF